MKLSLMVTWSAFALLAILTGLDVSAAPAAGGAAPAHGEFVHANGAMLWTEVRGDDPGMPLVVLNGGPGVSHSYMLVSAVWDSLAHHRRVIFYDQRGTGRSPTLTKAQTCTLADQIADLDALRAHWGFGRMDVLGHSWGGTLALAYAARHPERIHRLIVCDSGAPKWDDTKFLFRDLFPEATERQDAVQFAEQQGDTAALHVDSREYQSMLACDPDRRAALRDGELPAFSVPVNTALNADLHQVDLNPGLPKFNFPALVLCGRFDANVAPSVAWKIHKLIPNSEFTVFERSGHLPFYEQPAEFLARVERFLAGQ